jgi:hypothetical protein
LAPAAAFTLQQLQAPGVDPAGSIMIHGDPQHPIAFSVLGLMHRTKCGSETSILPINCRKDKRNLSCLNMFEPFDL